MNYLILIVKTKMQNNRNFASKIPGVGMRRKPEFSHENQHKIILGKGKRKFLMGYPESLRPLNILHNFFI